MMQSAANGGEGGGGESGGGESALRVGARALCNWQSMGIYHPCTVLAVLPGPAYCVLYDDGWEEDADAECVLAVPPAEPVVEDEPLSLDCVGVDVCAVIVSQMCASPDEQPAAESLVADAASLAALARVSRSWRPLCRKALGAVHVRDRPVTPTRPHGASTHTHMHAWMSIMHAHVAPAQLSAACG
jgi:hypothetical protein